MIAHGAHPGLVQLLPSGFATDAVEGQALSHCVGCVVGLWQVPCGGNFHPLFLPREVKPLCLMVLDPHLSCSGRAGSWPGSQPNADLHGCF